MEVEGLEESVSSDDLVAESKVEEPADIEAEVFVEEFNKELICLDGIEAEYIIAHEIDLYGELTHEVGIFQVVDGEVYVPKSTALKGIYKFEIINKEDSFFISSKDIVQQSKEERSLGSEENFLTTKEGGFRDPVFSGDRYSELEDYENKNMKPTYKLDLKRKDITEAVEDYLRTSDLQYEVAYDIIFERYLTKDSDEKKHFFRKIFSEKKIKRRPKTHHPEFEFHYYELPNNVPLFIETKF